MVFIHLTYTDRQEFNEHSFQAFEKVLYISYSHGTKKHFLAQLKRVKEKLGIKKKTTKKTPENTKPEFRG